MSTLGREIGVGERQAQYYVRELERNQLVRVKRRFVDGAQRSNSFEFLWHEVFEAGGARYFGGGGARDSPEESQFEESQLKESQNIDLDSLPPEIGHA
jgi:hypothetical protein